MSKHQASQYNGQAVSEQAPRELTESETEQVGAGCVPLVVVAIAVACAVLLSHD
jgi:hypothetical protein